MKNFLVLYYISDEAMEKMKHSTPEDHLKGMKPWYDWRDQQADSIVDFWSPIGKAQRVTATGNIQKSNRIAGYSVVRAHDVAKASKIMSSNPHLSWAKGNYIEVCEVLPM